MRLNLRRYYRGPNDLVLIGRYSCRTAGFRLPVARFETGHGAKYDGQHVFANISFCAHREIGWGTIRRTYDDGNNSVSAKFDRVDAAITQRSCYGVEHYFPESYHHKCCEFCL